jgi:dihydrofolate reductase
VSKVTTLLTMSLDGFIAGANDSPELPLGEGGQPLFNWYFSGDTELKMPMGIGDLTFRLSPASAEVIQEARRTTGAIVTGRRTFDIAHGWGGRHPLDAPVFVVTHTVPAEWLDKGFPFTFVTNGVASAVAQARAVAGEKNVAVGAASIVRQCLNAGLLGEINVALVPLLLGRGVRLFDQFSKAPIELETTRVVDAPGVTHLRYRVLEEVTT